MHPLWGKALGTLWLQDWVTARTVKTNRIFLQFVSSGFLSLFVYLFTCLFVLAH